MVFSQEVVQILVKRSEAVADEFSRLRQLEAAVKANPELAEHPDLKEHLRPSS